MSDNKEKIKQISDMMDMVVQDTSVPRNIRHAVYEARKRIMGGGNDDSVNLASAIYTLDDISNDINMPFHSRTEIWNIVSELERLKEELK